MCACLLIESAPSDYSGDLRSRIQQYAEPRPTLNSKAEFLVLLTVIIPACSKVKSVQSPTATTAFTSILSVWFHTFSIRAPNTEK